MPVLLFGVFVGIPSVLILLGRIELVFLLSGLVLAAWTAYQMPTLTTVLLIGFGVVPVALGMVPGFPDDSAVIVGGVRVLDVVLVGMTGAAVVRLLSRRVADGVLRPWLRIAALVLALWIFGETVRNLGPYGLSAFGEMRSRYLVLVIPVYIFLFGREPKYRRAMELLTVVATLCVPVLLVPYVGMAKGWSIGPSSRFFPAASSYATILASLWLILRAKHHLTVRAAAVLWAFVPVGALFVFVDGHRSAWLALAVLLIALIRVGELRLERAWAWGTILAIVTMVLVGAVQSLGIDPVQYVLARAGAFVDPLADRTSAWRAYVWLAQLSELERSPLVGQGLGGYWSIYVPQLEGTVTASPHSMYIQTLVKLGAVGLVLYVACALGTLREFMRRVRMQVVSVDADRILVILACVLIPASLAFQLVYALETASLVWLGLGLASLPEAEA